MEPLHYFYLYLVIGLFVSGLRLAYHYRALYQFIASILIWPIVVVTAIVVGLTNMSELDWEDR